MKVGLIHTTLNSVEPSNTAFHKLDKNIETVNYLNEGIMPELRSSGASNYTDPKIPGGTGQIYPQ